MGVSVQIRSIALATPRGRFTQSQAAGLAAGLVGAGPGHARALAALYRRAGVDGRAAAVADEDGHQSFYPSRAEAPSGPRTSERMALYAAIAPELALDACRRCLREAGLGAGGITHLVTASCTGFDAPGVDIALVGRLGLPSVVQRVHLGFMGCHAAINALRCAQAFVSADPEARVLVCCVELCSLHFQYAPDAGDGATVANALFADGAAACLVKHGDDPALPTLVSTASGHFAGTGTDMGWRIGDHGFAMSLSARVPGLLEQRVGPWVGAWLSGLGLDASGVGSWGIHPGGPRVVEGVRRGLGLDAAACGPSLAVLREHGNMSSPTVLFILDRLLRAEAPRPIALLAFGPGLAGEAALIR